MLRTADKRFHLLTAGAEVMHLQGYNGTGVKEIVDAAGVPKGSFYNYFESKEAFAVEALEYLARKPLDEFRSAMGNSQLPALDRVTGFYEAQVDNLSDCGSFCSGCFVGNLCQEMSDASEAIAKEVDRILGDYEDILAECLKQAKAEGALAQHADPHALASFIQSGWEGALMRMKSAKSAVPLNSFLAGLRQTLGLSG